MTSYRLDEWFWAMFEPTWIWPNFTFGQLFMWIGANSDTSSVGPSNKDENALIMQVVLKDLCLLQWQIVWYISQWFYKNQISCLDGLIKHGTLYTCHSITLYYVDTFTTVCLNKIPLLWKGWVCLYIMSENVNKSCSVIKFHAPLFCQGHCC